jgi:hypothetical protein
MRAIVSFLLITGMLVVLPCANAVDQPGVNTQPKAGSPGSAPTGATSARPIGQAGKLPAGPGRVLTGGPTIIPAQIDVSCSDGKSYTISTGTGGGGCTLVNSNGHVDGGYCGDTKGNGSSVFCGIGCTGATGNGKCTNKQ